MKPVPLVLPATVCMLAMRSTLLWPLVKSTVGDVGAALSRRMNGFGPALLTSPVATACAIGLPEANRPDGDMVSNDWPDRFMRKV
jgi:hypothetical protein